VWGTIALVGLSLFAFLVATVVTVGMVIWERRYMGFVILLCIAGVVAVTRRWQELPDK
jgi:hypothetical protein